LIYERSFIFEIGKSKKWQKKLLNTGFMSTTKRGRVDEVTAKAFEKSRIPASVSMDETP